MIKADFRDIKIKGKVMRNKGYSTGTLKRKNGDIIPISMVGHKLDTYIARHGLNSKITIELDGVKINSKIDRVQRDLIFHNAINIDLIEI